MGLLAVYVALVAVGEGVAVAAGFFLDSAIPDWSALVFMVLVFGVLFAAWPLAVRLIGDRA